jgi:hypothetical protein
MRFFRGGYEEDGVRRKMDKSHFDVCLYGPVLVNGTFMGLITTTRGIRQGEPILSYLFLICAEALSSLLSRVGWYNERCPFFQERASSEPFIFC